MILLVLAAISLSFVTVESFSPSQINHYKANTASNSFQHASFHVSRVKSAITILPKPKTAVHANNPDETTSEEKEEVVRLGSGEYYSGFVNRQLTEEPEERITGDAVLIPSLKFAGICTAIIGGFLLVFLASNGLL